MLFCGWRRVTLPERELEVVIDRTPTPRLVESFPVNAKDTSFGVNRFES